jgi:hypothetical protein
MKKTLQKSGARRTNDGIDYLKKLRSTPAHLIKRSSMKELMQRIEEARNEKLKKAS